MSTVYFHSTIVVCCGFSCLCEGRMLYGAKNFAVYCDLWHAHCWWCHLQTGSGKTYTMGTGYTVGGSLDGVIPQVMQTIFKRIETLKHKADFQLRVSFIEVCRDLIYPSL